MLVLPALDLLAGQVVRLGEHGDFDRPTAYAGGGDGAVVLGRRFVDAGARRLHVVDLDAARGSGSNRLLVQRLVTEAGAEVQVAGGVRTQLDAQRWLECGAAAVVMGTAAVRDPELLARVAAAHPGQVLAALDVRDGRPAVAGWCALEELTVGDVLVRWREAALAGVVVTSVDRDGTLLGPDLGLLSEVLSWTGLPVTYSGGIASLADLRALATAGAAAVILGRSLLEGVIQLDEALSV
ncbi:MAG TPA: 1-(5-phosphoribosyl)-5-[(5-phosphoribosylamino)methylideneamino] imidazole-4-carboxamide isomerase [Candidatus Dormibacteraeota bacterium]|nr:1-(5-phosphoribosyl)-5-[(5-phosphoribosylamino)methylideneamino] imidazole-4-carboxamide isomerase [Candidatus Dormibacteraeota bacterium]